MPLTGIGIRSLSWRKALRSIGDGECVEVASAHKHVAVRDSKIPMVSGWRTRRTRGELLSRRLRTNRPANY